MPQGRKRPGWEAGAGRRAAQASVLCLEEGGGGGQG